MITFLIAVSVFALAAFFVVLDARRQEMRHSGRFHKEDK